MRRCSSFRGSKQQQPTARRFRRCQLGPSPTFPAHKAGTCRAPQLSAQKERSEAGEQARRVSASRREATEWHA